MPRSPISNLLPWTCRWTMAGLFCLLLTARVWGQETASASPYHLAIKVQAYSPLTWLAEPLNGDRNFPFTPRFWTGEVEVGLPSSGSLQLSFGVRHYEFERLSVSGTELVFDRESAWKASLAYRSYFRQSKYGTISGPYWSIVGSLMSAKGAYNFDATEYHDVFTMRYASIGSLLGWQFCFKKHLLLDLGLGIDIGIQDYTFQYELSRPRRPISPLEYLGLRFWKAEGAHPTTMGMGPRVSFGLGWLF